MIVKRILTALISIPVILTVHFGMVPVLLLLELAVVLALLEYFHILDSCNSPHQKYPGLLAVVLLPIGFYFQITTGIHFPAAIITMLVLVLLSLAVLSGDLSGAVSTVSVTLFGVLYIGWLSGHLILLRGINPCGESLVYLLLFVTWISDISAYLVGTKFGRHRLAERISPKKSWEGTIAGVVAAVVAALLWREVSGLKIFSGGGLSLQFLNPAWCILIGLLLGVGGQAGDLAESMLKRNAGLKDSGNILPGHGGILDRCDSLLFNIPLLYYCIRFILR